MIAWSNVQRIGPYAFVCGHCGLNVGSNIGYTNSTDSRYAIYICPNCSWPTANMASFQWPGAAYGQSIGHLPPIVESAYTEARTCFQVSAYTAVVLMCRKILMNLAVVNGADEGKPFVYYVEYLDQKGYVPPGGKGWVDHIRKAGNKGTHEIEIFSREQAEEVFAFASMLLVFAYEFPARLNLSPSS